MTINLTVNGRTNSVDVDPEMPLLWVLRDTLNLVGTKFGCGGGFCGACTVHLDGAAARSCTTPVGKVGGRRVTTIEGLANQSVPGSRIPDPGNLHPVQRAWSEIDVAQCGYCQAGQIMAAAAFLARTPEPSDEAIAAAMHANLCRCGTYMRVRDAVRRAAEILRTESR